MTQETAKELLRKTKVIRDNFYPEPIEPEHEDEQKITFEFLSEVINYLENDTDKLSVEKLQEQLYTAKKALTEIQQLKRRDATNLGMINKLQTIAKDALVAIGGDDESI
ncbi:hypothetical protein QUE96_14050 [Lactococcus lactis]|uniref:hypothetical protein n=1 Tax=Lactococcus lactis TaxID=1358 RepID=UPI0025A28C4F|nr:hypothetical protein [Lactococcus lactis]MDM7657694.1 hypothetical protein [Lactococcus lactis]